MNIKSSINLIRGILYLHEIIRCKSISRAAEENNMKASNLGIIINDLEKQTGTKLLKRTHLGSSPTAEGLRVAQYAVELEEQIQKIRQWHENTHPRNRTLNIYIAPNMELDNCRDFEVQHPDIKLNFIDEDILADVKVNNQPPADPAASFTELHIGSGVKQKICISCCEQNPRALKFFDFIVAKLLLLYGQSEP